MCQTKIALVVLLSLCLVGQAAKAAPPDGKSGFERRKRADASVDRNVLSPTAETIGKGDFTVNSYELLVIGGTYGITDDVQISASTLVPITTDIPFVLLSAVKWNFLQTGRVLLSLQPHLQYASDSGDTIGGIGAGILADFLLDDKGDFVVTLAETNTMAFGNNIDGGLSDGFIVTLMAGINARVGRKVKLMAEFLLPGGVFWDEGRTELLEEALLFNYGIRFFGESVAVDLCFLRPAHPDMDAEGLLMGFPYLTFSARF